MSFPLLVSEQACAQANRLSCKRISSLPQTSHHGNALANIQEDLAEGLAAAPTAFQLECLALEMIVQELVVALQVDRNHKVDLIDACSLQRGYNVSRRPNLAIWQQRRLIRNMDQDASHALREGLPRCQCHCIEAALAWIGAAAIYAQS